MSSTLVTRTLTARIDYLGWASLSCALSQEHRALFQTPISTFFLTKKDKQPKSFLLIYQPMFPSLRSCSYSPVENFSILSETEFTALSHPLFPRQVCVRAKKSSLCDKTDITVQ